MVVETFRGFVLDTVTGKIAGTIPVVDPKWGIRLNGAGTITASIPATSREVANLDIKAATTPLRKSLAFAYGQFIVEAGPILRRRYDEKSRRLELTAVGLWSIFDRRKALPGYALAIGVPVGGVNLSIGPCAPGSIARELVRVSIEDNPFGLGGLNIVLPEFEAGPYVKNIPGFDLRWIGEALNNLTQEQDGVDIRFRPQFMGADPTRVEWALETGDPLLSQTGPDWRWDGSRPKTNVVGFGADESAEGIAARAWVPGAGQERDMLVGAATNLELVEAGWPWTETDNASKQEADQGVITGLAEADLLAASGPEEQFSITVRTDGINKLGEYLPGDFATVVIPANHPILDPGPVRVRIMALDGDWGTQVKITVAPFIGAVSSSAFGASSTVASGEDIPEVPYPDDNLYPSYNLYPA
jgi:hypothetical protein